MYKFPNIVAFLVVLIWLPACGQQSFHEKVTGLYQDTVPLIHADQLEGLKSEHEVFILDSREPEEFQVSHLSGARYVGYDAFSEAAVADIPKDASVVVYCTVGYRSERIGERLQKIGFKNVVNLYGGIFEWKNQGHEVINMNRQPTDSVHTYSKSWSQWLENGIKVYD